MSYLFLRPALVNGPRRLAHFWRTRPLYRWGTTLLLSLVALIGNGQPRPALTAQFTRLLAQGDSVYAEKKGYRSFLLAQRYYDRARTLADQSGDTLLLAEALFAKGRVYDAWNQQPHQTVHYFQQAAALFRRRPAAWRRYFYVRYLVAHAYDKVPDSLRTVQELRRLRRELLAAPDSVRRQVPSTVEMALTATEVHAYALADSLLAQLVRRRGVRNDPETYNYLDHYFLTQARLAVYYRRAAHSPYLDSLRQGYARVVNPFDQVYYGLNLSDLYAAAGQYGAAYSYLRRSRALGDSLREGGDADRLRQSLFASEERAARQQRRYEAGRQRARTWALWGLGLGLAVITGLSAYLYRQQRLLGQRARALARSNAALATSNQQLDEQVAQVELLNKEIQHRVKNNLHMVYSMLHMQERRAESEAVREQLQAARLRVESIAALHDQLLRGPAEVPDLTAYFKAVVASAVNCLANEQQVVTHLQTAPFHLPPRAHLPLALLLNEWVTNSVKHAARPGEVLEITVRVQTQEGQPCLLYHDNGVALPPGQPAAPAGLGTQLISLLARQLGATLTTPPGQPYHYTLCLVPAA